VSEFTVNRPLAAGAKNLLDDLKLLDAKVTEELERGIREHYLEKSYVPGLAERMGVEAPRVRTPRWVYVEWRQIQSVQVSAYDDADAVQQVKDTYGAQLSRGELPYGFRQSRWEDRESRNSVMVSEPTATRPYMNHNLRFYMERGNLTPQSIQPDPEQGVQLDIPLPEMTMNPPVIRGGITFPNF
jgi:hypothetical protein